VLTLAFMNIISVLCIRIERLKKVHSMYQEIVHGTQYYVCIRVCLFVAISLGTWFYIILGVWTISVIKS
jgi:uncharacterized membrane protein